MAQKKILITGINGFVGTHLAQQAQKNGDAVFGIGTQSTPLLTGITYAQCDVRDDKTLARLISTWAPDAVVHLATFHGPQSKELPKKTFETNIFGSLNLFNACKDKDIKIVAVSSCAVYDKSPQLVDETAQVNPKDAYAVSKFTSEYFVKFFVATYNLNVIIARPFVHAGAGQKAIGFVSGLARDVVLIEQGLKEPILTVSNLDDARDYLDVSDVVEAYTLLLTHGDKGEIYNVCSGKKIFMRDIVRSLCSLTEKKITIIERNKVPSHSPIGDYSKLYAATGWNPKKDFLKETLPALLTYWRVELRDPSTSLGMTQACLNDTGNKNSLKI